MGGPEVDHLTDHRVAPLREVPAVQRDDRDEAVSLRPNAQLRRENLAALAIRARSRFQPGAADRLARNDDRAKPLSALHSCVSLTQARRNGGRYLRLWVAVRGALDPLVRLQDPGLDVPLGFRVQALQELRLDRKSTRLNSS